MSGDVSPTATEGVATISDLVINTADTGYVLSAALVGDESVDAVQSPARNRKLRAAQTTQVLLSL